MTDFLNKVFKIKRNYQIPQQLSDKTQTKLTQLYKAIKNSTYIEPIISSHKGLPFSSNYNYISKEIQDIISNSSYDCKIYHFKLKSGRTVKFYIMYEINDTTNHIELYEKISQWLSYIDTISNKKCSKTLNIYIYLTDLCKVLPKKQNEPFQEININSAFTFSCLENNEIFIYRKEEVFKVFIHETMHSFGLDFSSLNIDEADDIIKHNFKGIKSNDLRIYESYCETWAEIINILLKGGNINKYIFYEKKWALFQCGKVLQHHFLNYNDLFDKNKIYKEENTNLFSYFILKAINLLHVNDFVLFCDNSNTNLINFRNDQETVTKYCNFINNHSKSNKFIKELDTLNNWFYNGTISNEEMVLLKSMRMSLYG
jgi:hypothetical protein